MQGKNWYREGEKEVVEKKPKIDARDFGASGEISLSIDEVVSIEAACRAVLTQYSIMAKIPKDQQRRYESLTSATKQVQKLRKYLVATMTEEALRDAARDGHFDNG